MFGSDEGLYAEFKDSMKQEFEMTDLGQMAHYLGIEVFQRTDGILINQRRYAMEILKKFGMEGCKSIVTPMEPNLKLLDADCGDLVDATWYRSLIGSLRYLTCTRPDLVFCVGFVSRFMEEPREGHARLCKRILRYLVGTVGLGLMYPRGVELSLHGYCDSDWAGDVRDRKSTSGFVFFFGETAFTWCSKKQPVVALSTCEAEYIAAAACSSHGLWLRKLCAEIGFTQDGSTTIFVDNKSAIALSKNPMFHGRSKHIDMKFHFIRDCVATGEVALEYIKSCDQVADIFTKALKKDVFEFLRLKMGMHNLDLRGSVKNTNHSCAFIEPWSVIDQTSSSTRLSILGRYRAMVSHRSDKVIDQTKYFGSSSTRQSHRPQSHRPYSATLH